MSRYVVFDVETPNAMNHRMSAIGITVIENDEIVDEFYSLGLPFAQLAAMALVAALLNMAAPGIPGGGIVLMTSFLTIFGLPIDIIGPVAAFYRLLDMAFTTINVEGDIAANLIIAKSEANVLKS